MKIKTYLHYLLLSLGLTGGPLCVLGSDAAESRLAGVREGLHTWQAQLEQAWGEIDQERLAQVLRSSRPGGAYMVAYSIDCISGAARSGDGAVLSVDHVIAVARELESNEQFRSLSVAAKNLVIEALPYLLMGEVPLSPKAVQEVFSCVKYSPEGWGSLLCAQCGRKDGPLTMEPLGGCGHAMCAGCLGETPIGGCVVCPICGKEGERAKITDVDLTGHPL